MSDLPDGWTLATIKSVTGKIQQSKPDVGEMFTYIDISSIDRDLKTIVEPQILLGSDAPSRARKIVQTDDVLVSMTRPNLNAVAHVQNIYDGQIASTGFDVLRPVLIDSRWLFNVVRSNAFVEKMSEKVQGALYPAVKSADVRGFEFPLPPLNEQKRIADKLEQLLARVDKVKDKLEGVNNFLKKFRRSVFLNATTGVLTEEIRTATNFPEWKSVSIGDVCEESFYGPRFAKSDYVEDGIPTVRTTDMTIEGRILISSDTPKVKVSMEKLNRFKVQKGDLLVTRTGSIGVMAVFDGDYLAIPSAYLIRFRFKKEAHPRYIFYCLMSPEGQSSLGLSATAITQPNVNANSIKNIQIKLPSYDEQIEIIRDVEHLFAFADRLEARYLEAKMQVDKLTAAILAKAFRGELVSQDPNDEPAEKLLERIKANRKLEEAKEKARKKQPKGRKQTVAKLSEVSVKEKITKLPKQFSFDELRAELNGNYDEIKDILFNLLSETEPALKQVFDEKAKAMVFERTA